MDKTINSGRGATLKYLYGGCKSKKKLNGLRFRPKVIISASKLHRRHGWGQNKEIQVLGILICRSQIGAGLKNPIFS